jgi:hypothetical protein
VYYFVGFEQVVEFATSGVHYGATEHIFQVITMVTKFDIDKVFRDNIVRVVKSEYGSNFD